MIFKIIKIILISLVGIVLIQFLYRFDPPFVDEEFQQYYQEFITEADKHNMHIWIGYPTTSIKFEDELGIYSGLCIYAGFPEIHTKIIGYSYILISKKTWRKINNIQKRQLIWHELGHCALGYDHIKDTIMDNRFVQITEKDFEEFWRLNR